LGVFYSRVLVNVQISIQLYLNICTRQNIYSFYNNVTTEMPETTFTQEQSPEINHDINSPRFYGQNTPGKKRAVLLGILGFVVALVIVGLFVLVKSRKTELDILSPFSSSSKKPDDSVSASTVENPMTGVMFTEDGASSWNSIRPLGFMINNHWDARPQSGLVDADIVYEVVAEGGITRFLAFYLTNAPEKVGPVRSTREYYLVLAKELGDAMLMHHGYSPQALEAIQTWPVRSLQRGGADSDATCPGCTWRDNPRNVASEHTLYADSVALRKRGDELGWEGVGDFKIWKFKEDTPILEQVESSGPVEDAVEGMDPMLEIDFWYEGDYSGIFEYKPDSNSYLRYTGYDEDGAPIPHKDYETKEQVEVKNVIVQFVAESHIAGDDKSRLEYQLVGSGEGLVFMDGIAKKILWTKEERDSRTVFYNLDGGEEIAFNRGKFWIAIVPDRNVEQVTY
jgi:hypothetical protein